MPTNRREFIKQSTLAGLALTTRQPLFPFSKDQSLITPTIMTSELNLIGPYGPWAAGLQTRQLPSLSFRRSNFKILTNWKKTARNRTLERLGIPNINPKPVVTVHKKYVYDGLDIEELTWNLPYGRPTAAILLKPQGAKSPLPGILGFHDHGGNKYFGTQKITKTGEDQNPLMVEHQQEYYGGSAWANALAKKGYVVLVSDAFPFASRRVMLADVLEHQRQGLIDPSPHDAAGIDAYNQWAGQHEHIMAKSLFSAGTTWPGVFFAEDRIALDILAARPEVDAKQLGCAGLSGGGMRTVFMAGLDERIKCCVCVGFMTTWRDFVLYKSFTHTWMTYVPILPNELDFPEILGLRVPLPTLVLSTEQDQLYTLSEMQLSDNILKEIYKKAGATDKYRTSFYQGPHKFDVPMQQEAFAWFDQWLKS